MSEVKRKKRPMYYFSTSPTEEEEINQLFEEVQPVVHGNSKHKATSIVKALFRSPLQIATAIITARKGPGRWVSFDEPKVTKL